MYLHNKTLCNVLSWSLLCSAMVISSTSIQRADAAVADALSQPNSTAISSAPKTATDKAGDRQLKAATSVSAIANPILFATQVPLPGDVFKSRISVFANHLPDISLAPRGGDLMIRYPNGTLRNLTQEAGFGQTGSQGANSIAVRDPSVHWSGTKALFSMVVGAPLKAFELDGDYKWQIYEVSGLAQGQTVSIRKIAGQPNYNNVTPIYDTKDRILFTSDRPRDGQAHLYPQLDEYESTRTVTGLWQLDPTSLSLRLLNHTPSGLFSPTIDSFGRVIFTRWDHLQRDQQNEDDGYNPTTYASEAQNAQLIANTEVFPESRTGQTSAAYGPVNAFTFNLFQPWEMNEDGTAELTLNHAGRHELSFGYVMKSFASDNAMSDITPATFADGSRIANTRTIRTDGGIVQIKEDPTAPGTFYGTYVREFGSMNSGALLKFNGEPTLNAEQMKFVDVLPVDTNGGSTIGLTRDSLPLSNGGFVAVNSSLNAVGANIDFRLKEFTTSAAGIKTPSSTLTGAGITKSVSWWDGDSVQKSYSGLLWELEPVEVVARTRPTARVATVATIEQQVMTEEGVNEATLKAWLKANDLALIVTRNHTSRDRADVVQPQNLQVPGGVKTVANNGRVYDISHFQIYQAEMLRSYEKAIGRRPLPRTMPRGKNMTNPTGPVGSVKIALDGSSAAFVPANRALTWQTTDTNGEPIVRERVWVTMQPGEIRTCAGCHGENAKNQAGVAGERTNKPQALRDLLAHWKTLTSPTASLAFDIDGSGGCTSADSLLLLRYLKGVRNAALIAGVDFPASATRRTADAIVAQIESVASSLDIDGDGRTLATTDGLLFSRYTKTLTGASLTASVRNPMVGGGTKTDADIKSYIDARCIPQ